MTVDTSKTFARTVEFYLKELAEEILWDLGAEGEKISPKHLGEKMGVNRHLAWAVLRSLQDDEKATHFSREEGGGWIATEFLE